MHRVLFCRTCTIPPKVPVPGYRGIPASIKKLTVSGAAPPEVIFRTKAASGAASLSVNAFMQAFEFSKIEERSAQFIPSGLT